MKFDAPVGIRVHFTENERNALIDAKFVLKQIYEKALRDDYDFFNIGAEDNTEDVYLIEDIKDAMRVLGLVEDIACLLP